MYEIYCSYHLEPVGMAHTYMASAALKGIAKKLGAEIRVETQGMTVSATGLPQQTSKSRCVILTMMGDRRTGAIRRKWSP
jgi:fructose-specific phosphotransferase system component IIB